MQKTFEDLRAFQRAIDFMVDVYAATDSFPGKELYGLTSQMRRAACSVSHIAEGQGRLSYGEWRQMLSQGRGSLYEVQAQIIASERLGFLSAADAKRLRASSRAAGIELAGLIAWVRKREAQAKRTKTPKSQTTSN